jgi:hypothetical protein
MGKKQKKLKELGFEELSKDFYKKTQEMDKIYLPGVGEWADALSKLLDIASSDEKTEFLNTLYASQNESGYVYAKCLCKLIAEGRYRPKIEKLVEQGFNFSAAGVGSDLFLLKDDAGKGILDYVAGSIDHRGINTPKFFAYCELFIKQVIKEEGPDSSLFYEAEKIINLAIEKIEMLLVHELKQEISDLIRAAQKNARAIEADAKRCAAQSAEVTTTDEECITPVVVNNECLGSEEADVALLTATLETPTSEAVGDVLPEVSGPAHEEEKNFPGEEILPKEKWTIPNYTEVKSGWAVACSHDKASAYSTNGAGLSALYFSEVLELADVKQRLIELGANQGNGNDVCGDTIVHAMARENMLIADDLSDEDERKLFVLNKQGLSVIHVSLLREKDFHFLQDICLRYPQLMLLPANNERLNDALPIHFACYIGAVDSLKYLFSIAKASGQKTEDGVPIVQAMLEATNSLNQTALEYETTLPVAHQRLAIIELLELEQKQLMPIRHDEVMEPVAVDTVSGDGATAGSSRLLGGWADLFKGEGKTKTPVVASYQL